LLGPHSGWQDDQVTTDVLRGKVAIVTGATANLGLEISHRLAELGADVVLNYHTADRAADTEAAAKALNDHNSASAPRGGTPDRMKVAGRAIAVAADVTRSDEVKALFDRAVEEFGRVDILVNNAGLVIKKPLADTTDEDFDRAFAVNTKAKFLTMREAAHRLAPGGRIVNVITSIVAFTIPFYSVYAGSKGAVEHFTKALAKEIGDRGITVNCVARRVHSTRRSTTRWRRRSRSRARRAARWPIGSAR
jgi:NAD(P)-dependent dehydrogenase (short-subunit alcohol dehydrogenase family)